MSFISTVDARALFTKKLIAVYKEKPVITSFLRSFFRTNESNTKEISIEVQRGTEKIAVDIERGTEGNRNQFSRSTEKIFIPPYYREYFDATELDFYDMLFTMNGSVDVTTFGQWLDTVVEKVSTLQDKIERRYELQASQVFETGIVTIDAPGGTNIDFKRKALSLVDKGAGNYWANAGISPYVDLETAATFIRVEGKSQGNIYNAIFGQQALQDFLDNDVVKERADLRRISLDTIRMPQKEATGGVLHGEVSAGAYVVRIWTYPEFFSTETTTGNSYMNDTKVVVLPENPNFVLGFAAVPQLIGTPSNVGAGIAGKRGAFLVGEYMDERNASHIIDIKSAGITVPVAVDMIHTTQVVA